MNKSVSPGFVLLTAVADAFRLCFFDSGLYLWSGICPRMEVRRQDRPCLR